MLSVHRQRFLIVFALPCLAHLQVLYGGSEWLKKKKKTGPASSSLLSFQGEIYCQTKHKKR